MGVGGLRQRKRAVDAQTQHAGVNPGQHVTSPREQLFPRMDVMMKGRPSQKERPLRIQHLGIQGRDGAAGLSVEHHQAAQRQAVQTLLEGILSDRVVHYLDAAPGGQPLHFRLEVHPRVDNGLIGAQRTRNFGLVVGRHGGDDPCSPALPHLHQQLADATGGSMDQATLALFQRVRAV